MKIGTSLGAVEQLKEKPREREREQKIGILIRTGGANADSHESD